MRDHLLCWAWPRRACAVVFGVFLVLGSHQWFPWIKGSMTATNVFGVLRLADPLAALEVTLAARSAPLSLLVGAGILLGIAVLLGRVFCGWLCPLGLVLDVNEAVRRRLRQWVLRRANDGAGPRLPSQAKYFLLGLVLGASLLARVPTFQLISPINVLAWSAVFAPGPELWIIAGILLVELIVPRVWCRALCPLGALYSLVGRFGVLGVRIRHDPADKAACRQCTIRCPMGVRVMEDYVLADRASIDDGECSRCGACVDACPQGGLRLGFG